MKIDVLCDSFEQISSLERAFAIRIVSHLTALGHEPHFSSAVLQDSCAEAKVVLLSNPRQALPLSLPHVVPTAVILTPQQSLSLNFKFIDLSHVSALVVLSQSALGRLPDSIDRRLCLVCPPVALEPPPPQPGFNFFSGITADSLVFLCVIHQTSNSSEVSSSLFSAMQRWCVESSSSSSKRSLVLLDERILTAEQRSAALAQCFALVVLNDEEESNDSSAIPPQIMIDAAMLGCPIIAKASPANSILFPGSERRIGTPVSSSMSGFLFRTEEQMLSAAESLCSHSRLREAVAANARKAVLQLFPSSGEQRTIDRMVRLLQIQLRKAAFLAGPQGKDYGYQAAGVSIDGLNSSQFGRLGRAGITYLDHTGAALYTAGQVEAAAKQLQSTVFANPHSSSSGTHLSCANITANVVREAREAVAKFLGTDLVHHDIVFTSGTTAGLKLVGETFAWTAGSVLCFLQGNHTSVVGIREFAHAAGASVMSVQYEAEVLQIVKNSSHDSCHLLVMPAQSNFTGAVFNLGLASQVHSINPAWHVLLDAAAFVPHSRLDLNTVAADFVTLSFYKIFGFPTGIGALIVRRSAEAVLTSQKYFGGGTLSVCVQETHYHVLRDGLSARLEAGTLSFLDISLLCHGFAAIDAVGGIDAVDRHTTCLIQYLMARLQSLKHSNGVSLLVIAESPEAVRHGPIATFNLRRADGSWIGPSSVGSLAAAHGIQLRTGCMCNPSACQHFIGLTPEQVQEQAASGKKCWSDEFEIIGAKPTAAIRVSIGYPTTFEDVEMLISFLTRYLD